MLNPDQYQVLLGSFLGDGGIQTFNEYGTEARLALSHSGLQLKYLAYKASAFGISQDNFIFTPGGPGMILGRPYARRDGYSMNTKAFCLDKPVSLTSMRHMSPLALAIWVMDDGSLRNRYSPDNKRLSITIDSNSFSLRENQFLVKVLKHKFNLDATIQSTRNYYRLSFNKTNSIKLLELIGPYVPNCFTGKFKHEDSTPLELDSSFSSYAADTITSITPTHIQETYDLTVADTHNFIVSNTAQNPTASGTIVHNCQNIYSFNHTINCFSVMQDEGTTLPMSQSFRVDEKIASKIEGFVQKNLDPSMTFKGVPIKDKTIHTKAFIARTNGALIAKMIELNELGVEYGLTRTAKQLFALPLALCGLKPGGYIALPEYRHLQTDVDHYFSNSSIREDYKSPLSYIRSVHDDDQALQTVISLLIRHTPRKIIECYEEARKHEKTKGQTYILGTGHSMKGLEADQVEIAEDLNTAVQPILLRIATGLPLEALNQAERTELNLYYVACSRARKELLNATHLQPYKQTYLSILDDTFEFTNPNL